MVGRDVLLLCETVWALAFTELRNFSPVHLGQASTLLQVVIVVAVLAAPIRPTPELKSIAEALFAPAAALAIASFIHYSWRGIAMVAATRSPLR
jgi:phosphatidylglycerophosphate synthase